MPKKVIKQEHMEKKDVQENLEERRERLIDGEVKEALEKILQTKGRALQPYIEYNEVAMVPRLRLVRLSKEQLEKNKKESDGETESS